MTITQERRNAAGNPIRTPAQNPQCTGRYHTPTQGAWNEGCRCPGAVEAHDRWKAGGGRRYRRRADPALDDDGNCVASAHLTRRAYIELGCRCPEAVERHQRRGRSDRESAMQYWRETRYVLRVTGGRLRRDPRRAWRGGAMAVDRVNLLLLVRGLIDSPTKGEKIAAVAILSQRGGRTGLYDTREIGNRLGITPDTVSRYRRDIRELRKHRTERRLADVRWRVALTAAGAGAKQRRAEEYRRACEAAAARRLHYRTIREVRERRTERRLRESQERAKVVAAAIEKRTRRG